MTLKNIGISELSIAAAQPGPCLTLLVPDHHPGAPDSSQRAHVKGLLKSVKEHTPGLPSGFETTIEELNGSLPEGGGPGLAIYRTADSLTTFNLPGAPSKAVVASHPYVIPLLQSAFAAHDLFVLGLSAKHLRLLEYVDGVCRQLALPDGIPATLDESRHPRHGTPGEGHTPAGSDVGGMRGVRFGTSGDRESARDAMGHFCALIDQGLRPVLKDRPLLLMGVKEEIAAFRRVSHCHSLLHTEVDGNVELFTPAHIAGLAQKAALAEYQRLGEQVLAEFRELRDRTRVSHDPREVLKAAAEGRVHKLCVRAGAEVLEPLDATLDRAHLPTEDLINAAAAETLSHGGEVYLLPLGKMAIKESVCAILRY